MILTIDVPPDLWMSSNRMPTHRGHLHRIVVGLHDLAAMNARVQHAEPINVPARADWTIQYPHGAHVADAANAQPTTKRLLDGLVKAGLLVDDDSRWIVTETFRRGENLPRRRPNAANPRWTPAAHRVTLRLEPYDVQGA